MGGEQRTVKETKSVTYLVSSYAEVTILANLNGGKVEVGLHLCVYRVCMMPKSRCIQRQQGPEKNRKQNDIIRSKQLGKNGTRNYLGDGSSGL